jgi:hypothetical protein
MLQQYHDRMSYLPIARPAPLFLSSSCFLSTSLNVVIHDPPAYLPLNAAAKAALPKPALARPAAAAAADTMT